MTIVLLIPVLKCSFHGLPENMTLAVSGNHLQSICKAYIPNINQHQNSLQFVLQNSLYCQHSQEKFLKI